MSRATTLGAIAAAIVAGFLAYTAEKRLSAIKKDIFQLGERSHALAVELAQMRAEGLQFYAASASELAQLRLERTRSSAALAELRRWNSVRPISDLQAETLAVGNVKVLNVDIGAADVRSYLAVAEDLAMWQPKDDTDLPFPWPIRDGKPAFSSYYYAVNASILMRRWRVTGDKRFLTLISVLEDARERETVREGHSAFIAASSSLIQASAIIPAGWRSALANAFMFVGLLDLHEGTGDERYLDLARSYVAGLTDTETSEKLWRVDASQYLWFEEYPSINGRPTSVMNGHIGVVLALHRYWTVTGDAKVLPLIKAGLATAARYMWEVRNPGGISAYWLYDPTIPDYGPVRAVRFAEALLTISGHRTFHELSEALRTDMPIR